MAVELLPNVAFAAAATRSGTKDDPYMQRPVPIPTAFPMRRMVDFKFTRHPSLNLPEQRLTAIEKQLGERTRELLSIPVQRSAKRKNEPEG